MNSRLSGETAGPWEKRASLSERESQHRAPAGGPGGVGKSWVGDMAGTSIHPTLTPFLLVKSSACPRLYPKGPLGDDSSIFGKLVTTLNKQPHFATPTPLTLLPGTCVSESGGSRDACLPKGDSVGGSGRDRGRRGYVTERINWLAVALAGEQAEGKLGSWTCHFWVEEGASRSSGDGGWTSRKLGATTVELQPAVMSWLHMKQFLTWIQGLWVGKCLKMTLISSIHKLVLPVKVPSLIWCSDGAKMHKLYTKCFLVIYSAPSSQGSRGMLLSWPWRTLVARLFWFHSRCSSQRPLNSSASYKNISDGWLVWAIAVLRTNQIDSSLPRLAGECSGTVE